MASSHFFQNNLRFALRREPPQLRDEIPRNTFEKIGDALSWFAYDFKDYCLITLFDPRSLTVCLTAFAMIFTAFLFYPSYTWDFFSIIFHWIVDLFNWDYIRFCLWVACEITVFGMGMRALGRFTNHQLLQHYEKSQGAIVK